MPESSLVELIEAWEAALKAHHAWVASDYEPTDGDNPGELRYDAEERLRNRLLAVEGRCVAWKGSVYFAADGLRVLRNIRSADEIDREGRNG